MYRRGPATYSALVFRVQHYCNMGHFCSRLSSKTRNSNTYCQSITARHKDIVLSFHKFSFNENLWKDSMFRLELENSTFSISGRRSTNMYQLSGLCEYLNVDETTNVTIRYHTA